MRAAPNERLSGTDRNMPGKPKRKNLRAVSHKKRVQRALPDAFCCRCTNPVGFIVWPGKVQPRGFERPAIGFGKTAREAWESVACRKEGGG